MLGRKEREYAFCGFMDFEAIEMCRDNNISIVVTNIENDDCLTDVYNGGNKGTRVC